VSDFDDILGSGLNLKPSSIVQLQPVSLSHRNGFWKIKENIIALICGQAKAAAMTLVKLEGKRACCLFLRPMPRREMNGSTMHCHNQYMK
jgi:hypothetical protein